MVQVAAAAEIVLTADVVARVLITNIGFIKPSSLKHALQKDAVMDYMIFLVRVRYLALKAPSVTCS